ncbi:hypothetical protein LXG23DRAFT_51321 [Yarrowia lipolytica]|uniref:Uncharacterized protein n=1 Tax=Yarrowia lipolytica TaxID=4952 RepID=A0A1D8N5C1_YARLL|nr:hypothetical protein YALI1_A19025g [Yarrowia lipolytica]KAJ8051791.1 hypothetical protein LXG23DRAFT_51321 [Yarrowia lipolytica]RMI95535.1 hypothetical protein BD777DRAFT_118349 [Yarrowia lipolytica]
MDHLRSTLYAIAQREGIAMADADRALAAYQHQTALPSQPNDRDTETQTDSQSRTRSGRERVSAEQMKVVTPQSTQTQLQTTQTPQSTQTQVQSAPTPHMFPTNICFATAVKLLETARNMECREYIAQPKTNHNWNEILRTLEAQRQPFDQLEDMCLVIHIWNGNSTSAACKLLFEKFPHRSYNQWLYRYKNLKEAGGEDLEGAEESQGRANGEEEIPEEVFRTHFKTRFPDVYTDRVLAKSSSLSHDKPDRKWYSFAVFEDWAIVLCLSNQGATPTIIEAARELHTQFPHRTLCAWNNRCRMMIQMSSMEFSKMAAEAKAGYDHEHALKQLEKRFPEVYKVPVSTGPLPSWTQNKPTTSATSHRLVKENKKIRFTDVENTATYAHIALCQTVQAAARQMAHLFPHRSVRAWDKRMRVLRAVPGWQQTAQVSCSQYSYEATIEHLQARFPQVYNAETYRPENESMATRADESFLRKARFDEFEDHVVLVHLSLSPTTTATKLHELFPHRTQQAWRQRTLHVQNKVDANAIEHAKTSYSHENVMRHFRQRFPWVYREIKSEPVEAIVKVESPIMPTPQIMHTMPPRLEHIPPPSPALAFPLTPPLNTEELPRSLATLERLLILKTMASSKSPATDLSRAWPHKHVYEWTTLCDSLRNASNQELVVAMETFCEQELRAVLAVHYPQYRVQRRKSWIDTVLIKG